MTQPWSRPFALPAVRICGGTARPGTVPRISAHACVGERLRGARSRVRMLATAAALLVVPSASPRSLSAAPPPGATPAPPSAAFDAAEASIVPPPVTIEMEHSGELYLDHNSPCVAGPRAAYVPFRVTNTSASTVTGLTASISIVGAVADLGAGQAARQYIGALAPGETRHLYWFVSYDCTIDQSAGVTLSVTNDAGESTTGVFALVTRKAISAAAGGNVSTYTLGPGAIAGQIIPLDVTFVFSGNKVGDTFNLQPAGNQGFDAACFQLVGSLITGSQVPAIPVGTQNRLFFTATSAQGGSAFSVSARFYFRYNCSAVSSTARPYAMAHDNNRKYSGNYDGTTDPPPSFPPADAPSSTFATSFSVSPSDTFGGARVAYRMVIANTSAFDATIDSISVALPPGFAYDSLVAGSGVTLANAGSVPAAGAVGTIRFRGVPRPPNSTQPASFAVAAGDSLILLFHATAPATPGWYTATATAYAGTAALPMAAAVLRMRPVADLALALAGPLAPVAGDTVELVVTLTNGGPHTADTLFASVTLPTGFALVSATGSAVLSGATLAWPERNDLAVGDTVVETVQVRFDSLGALVASGVALTSTSRDPVAANSDGTTIGLLAMTVGAPAVAVTPDGLASPSRRLAGTGYSQRFVVYSDFGRVETFDVLAAVRAPAAFVALDSMTVDGAGTPAGDSTRTDIPARDSVEVRVFYTVAAGVAGQDVIDVVGRSLTYAAASLDSAFAEIRRVRPELSLVRSVGPATVLPGTVLTHQLSLGNPGESDATSVVLSDSLPTVTEFEVGSPTSTLPAGVSVVVSYSQDGGATWTYSPVSGACGAAAGFDGCVDAIRWEFTGDFTAGAPSGSGLLQYRVRVP